MADTRISQLTALGAAPATGDLLPLVDVSDTTDSAAGTTKKMTVANLFTSPSLTTPALGTPSSGNLSNCTAYPVGSISGLGTGVATALGTNVGSAGSPVVNGGALGTPSSGTLSSATGLPISTGVSGLGANIATALAVAVGSAGAPVINGGVLGTPSSGTVTNLTGTASININGTVGANTPAAGTFTTATINTSVALADGAQISLIVPTVDGTATGPVTSAFVSGYTSSAIGDLVYLDSNGKWQKTDADSTTTSYGLLGIALAVAATDAALKVALPGAIVYSTAFPTLTIGATYYISDTTAGAIQSTIPTGADNVIRVVGFGVHADKLMFLPSSDAQVTVA